MAGNERTHQQAERGECVQSGALFPTDLIDLDRSRGVCDTIRWGFDDDRLGMNTFTVDSCHTIDANVEHRLLVRRALLYRSWRGG